MREGLLSRKILHMFTESKFNPIFPKKKNFRKQSLRGRSFENQILINADFSYSDLRDTNFSGAVLRGANFFKTISSNADFINTDIRGAKFTNANLTKANFRNSKGGFKNVTVLSWIIITVFLSIVLGIANFYAGDIPFSDDPFITSLDNETYQQYFLIPRIVALVTVLTFVAIIVCNGFKRRVAVVAVAIDSLFMVSNFIAAIVAPDAAWRVVDYTLWVSAGALASVITGTFTLAVNAIILGILLTPKFSILPAGAASLTVLAMGLDWIEPLMSASTARLYVLPISIILNFISPLVARRAIKGKKNYLWLRKLSLFLISNIGNTNFRQANLS
ncbi:MAG: pentapeptide repeat-containing protein, partial [Bacteroidota bacterium]